jgi:hypothetical protein
MVSNECATSTQHNSSSEANSSTAEPFTKFWNRLLLREYVDSRTSFPLPFSSCGTIAYPCHLNPGLMVPLCYQLRAHGVAKAQDGEKCGPALHTKNPSSAVWATEPRDTGFLRGSGNIRATTQNIKQYHETEVIFCRITNMINTKS